MAKRIKAALLLCLTTCLAVFAVAFAACGDSSNDTPPSGNPTYSVTVLYEGGTPVVGVGVQLCLQREDGTLGMCFAATEMTNESGVGVVEIDYESNNISADAIFHIQINKLPGYTADIEGVDPITLGFDSGVSTTPGTYSYTVTVVDRTPQA